MDSIISLIMSDGFELLKNLITAGLILVIGFWLSGYVVKLSGMAMEKAKIEPTLVSFLKSLLKAVIKFLIIFCALTSLGFATGSLVALLGTCGAAIALSLKDSLSSFAGGIIILFTQPFVKGDFIEVAGNSGTVKKIEIMSTVLITGDNKVVNIPNNQMISSTIINYSKEDTRRVDLDFGVSYSTDIELAKNLISKVVNNHELSLKEPEAFVRVSAYADSAIIITTRVWCKNEDYWSLKFDLLEQIKEEFDKNNIEIPFNQLDVNINRD